MAKRFWTYSRDHWDPEFWWQKLLYFGNDEHHRRTVVLPWFTGYLVVALWRFSEKHCDCVEFYSENPGA